MKRAVSNLLGLLIVVGIVVAMGGATALLVGGIGQRLQPTGASVSIQSVKVQKIAGDNKQFMTEAVLYIGGSESVRINSIYIIYEYGGSPRWCWGSIRAPEMMKYFTPGATVAVVARHSCVYVLDDYQPVRVQVEVCTVSGQCIHAVASALVQPWRV